MSNEKDRLREKLLLVRNSYLVKNKSRIDKIKPFWNESQKNIPNILNIDPIIEICEDNKLRDLWWYGRNTIHSAPLVGEVGRRIHYLVRDRNTKFIIGMVGLTSDLVIPIRDKYIGWNRSLMWKDKKINFLMNVQHCFSEPTFSNYLTGKLCALSIRSKEVQEYFKNKYGHDLAAMTVTSLYKKSSMYNRLEGFIYIGNTVGMSALLIPLDQKIKAREVYKKEHGKYSASYDKGDGTIEKYGITKMYQKVGEQCSDNQRGVYIVPLAGNYREFLCGKDEILNMLTHPSFNTLVSYWRTRWLLPRIERLK